MNRSILFGVSRSLVSLRNSVAFGAQTVKTRGTYIGHSFAYSTKNAPKVVQIPLRVPVDFDDMYFAELVNEFEAKYGFDLKECVFDVVTAIDAAIKKELKLDDGDRFIYLDPDNSDQLLINLPRAKSKIPSIKYDAVMMFNAACFFLAKDPPDNTMLASELLWACCSFVVKKFYAEMGILPRSHHGSLGLCLFAAGFHKDSSALAYTFLKAEGFHRLFYCGGGLLEDLEDALHRVNYFIECFPQIDLHAVRDAIQPFIDGKLKTKDDKCLRGVSFRKFYNYEEELFDTTYKFKYFV